MLARRFRVPSNDPARLIAITGIGERANGDFLFVRNPAAGSTRVMSPFAVALIEASERRRCVERLQTIAHLKEQSVYINLMEADPLPDEDGAKV